MPPTGALRPQQVDLIKRWIEQGADWPDSLANEIEKPPLDAKAVAMVEMLRTGDRQSFMKRVSEDPKILNARGPEGSTPFMYAVLYSDAATLEKLLKQGADPNKKNDANATALMWAAVDLKKTRVLLDHGAGVNAISNDLRTPLRKVAWRHACRRCAGKSGRKGLPTNASCPQAGAWKHDSGCDSAQHPSAPTRGRQFSAENRLIGLAWAGADKGVTQKAMKELLGFQRSDGGWSDLPSLVSAAYATGRALVALQNAGLPTSDPAYQRGVQFLLNSQQEDGSWYVRSRALGFQPYFDAGFPYGHDQWISAAGTNWATMALTLAGSAPAGVTSSAGLRFR
jgi:hypothetical protein